MNTAIDISNYTGYLSGDQVGYLREHADLVIVRLSTETSGNQHGISMQQIGALVAGAVPWQAYLWCYWRDSPYELWQRAQGGLPNWKGYYGARIWLDAEDTPDDANQAFDFIMGYARLLTTDEFVPGIYTGAWWLRQNAGILEGERGRYLAALPLWLANYTLPGDCTIQPVGAWERVAMHQYASRERLGPLGPCDLNVVCEPDPLGL